MSLTFYDKDFENNYEEFITYYPGYYQQVYEMNEILKAQGRLADRLENCIEQIYRNNFIDYADAETIGRLESFLHLEYNKIKDMEVRRKTIKAHLIGSKVSKASEIAAIIKDCTGYDANIRFEPFDGEGNNRLVIKCSGPEKEAFNLDDIWRILRERIPAHIQFLLIKTVSIAVDEGAKMHTGMALAGFHKKITTEVLNYGME